MRSLKTKEIAIHTLIKNDEQTNDFPQKYYNSMQDIAEALKLRDDLYVFETVHGFIVRGKPALRSQRFIQLNTKQLGLISKVKGLNFIRTDNDTISFHFSR